MVDYITLIELSVTWFSTEQKNDFKNDFQTIESNHESEIDKILIEEKDRVLLQISSSPGNSQVYTALKDYIKDKKAEGTIEIFEQEVKNRKPTKNRLCEEL